MSDRVEPATNLCTYAGYCTSKPITHVYTAAPREPEQYHSEDVCEGHLSSAKRLGFVVGYPPRVEPEDRQGSEVEAPEGQPGSRPPTA